MPRSGSTLQYNLVREIIEKMDKGEGEGFFSPQQSQEMFSQFYKWANDSSFHVIKTQSIVSDIEILLKTNNTYICYTYRDLRDVSASFERRFKCEGKDLLIILNDIVEEHYKIQKFNNLVSIKYEDMIGDLAATTQTMADFLHLSPGPELVSSVAREFSLENAKRKIHKFELRYKFEDVAQKILTRLRANRFMNSVTRRLGINYNPPFYDPKTLMHTAHIAPEDSSRGDYLTADQIQYITSTYQDWLVEYGYLPEK